MNPYFSSGSDELEVEIRTEAEADEFWSYVGRKKIRDGHGMRWKEIPA